MELYNGLLMVLDHFWDWVDDRRIVSRAVLAVTLWMSYRSFVWASAYATLAPGGAGTGDIALMLAAVLAPVATLQGYVFKAYLTDGTTRGANL